MRRKVMSLVLTAAILNPYVVEAQTELPLPPVFQSPTITNQAQQPEAAEGQPATIVTQSPPLVIQSTPPQPSGPVPPPCYPPNGQGPIALSLIQSGILQAPGGVAGQAGQAAEQTSTAPATAGPRQTGVIESAPSVPCRYANEFQDFVAQSTGYVLPMFGSNLFQTVPSTFAPVDHVSVPAEYVTGPGDEVMIRAWGQIDIDYHTTVDRSGSIYIPRVGNVRVAGLRFEQLRPFLRDAISRQYRDFDLDVSLGQLRSIQVFVVGEAQRPGAYTVGSLSTLVDVIFAAGGPSMAGSMRAIELRRGKEVITRLDLYDLLMKGDKSGDAKLLPGDVIYFNPIGPLVALNGSVNVPAIYELRDNQDLQGVLRMAGGLTAVASSQKVTVERIDERKTRHVEAFAMDYDGLAQPIRRGDIITVRPITGSFDNSVILRGNVANPGRYPWKEGLRVKDLLPSYESLLTREYWKQSTALNRSAQAGAAPGIGAFKNEVVHIAPDINWDYAVVERLNMDQLTTLLLPFNLRRALTEPESQENFLLQPNDVVTIFSQSDLRVPLGKQSKFVYLEGEFQAAGVYRAEPGETLRQLVERVGGFTPNAYLYGAQFTRVGAQQDQQEQLVSAIQRLEAEIEQNALGRLSAPGTPQDPTQATFRQALLNQRTIVAKLRQFVPTGRVVLPIGPNDTTVSALPDLPLEDGDRLIVPWRPIYVSVVGAVNARNVSLLYSPKLRASDYINLSGGTTPSADRGHAYVIRANGLVLSQQGWTAVTGQTVKNARLMPGDTIVVPEQLDKGAFMRGLKDWTQILGQIGLLIAGIKR